MRGGRLLVAARERLADPRRHLLEQPAVGLEEIVECALVLLSKPRVAVVAEWYPSPGDPVLGIWAHRQAMAAREAGAEVRVLALRRPIPPLAVARGLFRSRRVANVTLLTMRG